MPGVTGANIVAACGGHRGFLASPPSGFCFFNIFSSLWDGSVWAFHLPCLFFFFKLE